MAALPYLGSELVAAGYLVDTFSTLGRQAFSAGSVGYSEPPGAWESLQPHAATRIQEGWYYL